MGADGEPRLVYEGSAYHWRELHPESGETLTLENAILDAYRAATGGSRRNDSDDDPGERTFRVVGLFISGTNPPSDYKAHLVDHP